MSPVTYPCRGLLTIQLDKSAELCFFQSMDPGGLDNPGRLAGVGKNDGFRFNLKKQCG